MSDIFLISDTHWGHANFLNFLDEAGNKIRPFTNVEEMDEYMIEKWNSVVTKNSKVYHLGDVCFSLKTLDRVMPQLNGTKVLIKKVTMTTSNSHNTISISKIFVVVILLISMFYHTFLCTQNPSEDGH